MIFINILLLTFTIASTIIAIKINFKFDINQFLKNRRKIKIEQLKNICPHAIVIKDEKSNKIRSLFLSPPGTIRWQCQQCGLILNSDNEIKIIMEEYYKNPRLILERQKKYVKKAKKLKIA